MKVYTLTAFSPDGSCILLEVFDRPKSARKWLDETLNKSTRGSWTKLDKKSRSYWLDKVEYRVEEWVVLTE